MKLHACALLAAVLLAAGCAAPQSRPWWSLEASHFQSAIRPGVTTKDELRRVLGTPLASSVFPNLREEVWDYRFLEGTRPYVAEVHFDEQGRTKYYSVYPDRCPMRPVGCA